MKISVYAIAKDEEKIIRRWYKCFKEADEVCVLVNNSTDKTAQILRELGAKVLEKTYSHFRFDVARNEAMAMCSKDSDLLFSCDIDDVIERGWRKKVEHAWELGVATGKNPNCIIYTYEIAYEGSLVSQKMLRHSIHTPDGWYWKSRIHEYLEHRVRKEYVYYPKFTMTSQPAQSDHGCYLPLLEEECRNPDCEARSIHLLAREYLINQRYEEAIHWFEKFLAHIGSTWNSERCASMKFLSECYGHLGYQNAQELWLWKAMLENPKDRDAPYLLGQLLISKKEWKAAATVLEKCVAIEKPELDYPFFSLMAWTEHPWLCLAEARFYTGEWRKAEEAIAKALEIRPDSELGQKMKKDMEENRRRGAMPPQPPQEIPRERIDIPELA